VRNVILDSAKDRIKTRLQFVTFCRETTVIDMGLAMDSYIYRSPWPGWPLSVTSPWYVTRNNCYAKKHEAVTNSSCPSGLHGKAVNRLLKCRCGRSTTWLRTVEADVKPRNFAVHTEGHSKW